MRENKKLSHHRAWAIDPLVVYLPPSTKEDVLITYEIVADELPDPIKGELKITWSQKPTTDVDIDEILNRL